jgi:hypothetical protein
MTIGQGTQGEKRLQNKRLSINVLVYRLIFSLGDSYTGAKKKMKGVLNNESTTPKFK